jgi:hypothetical protein
MLTPYIDELNQAIREGLERRGLTVVHIAGLGIPDNFGICSVTLQNRAEHWPHPQITAPSSRCEKVEFGGVTVRREA